MTFLNYKNLDILGINSSKIRKISGIQLQTRWSHSKKILLNSANVALLLSTISAIDVKIGKLNKADQDRSKGQTM